MLHRTEREGTTERDLERRGIPTGALGTKVISFNNSVNLTLCPCCSAF